MFRGLIRSFGGNDKGAIAPLFALALFALIAVAGIAFDYARLAAMDSELQNAADQAALAAATQLDKQSGAITRATTAAQGGLVTNQTLLANDGGTLDVSVPTLTFYSTRNDAESDTNGFTDPDRFADAGFVRVTVAARTANYALTPVVAAISGTIDAQAVAGLGASICKTPPVMICNPSETVGNTNLNLDFAAGSYVGVGIKLISVGSGGGAWVPGNFGYLDTKGGSNGAPGLREALGWTAPPGNCSPQTGVDTKPGASVSVTDALNTRFDIYDSNQACPTGGVCPASINSRKDLMRPANASGGNKCKMHSQGWQEPSPAANQYLPTSATVPLVTTITPASMGFPRDMCHAVASSTTGYCSGPFGDGLWDRDAYFRTHYRRGDGTRWNSANWKTNTGLTASATRYQVYQWEIEHRGQSIDGVTILGPNPAGASGPTLVSYGTSICSSVEGYGTGTVPDDTTPDRRRITVAVVNCQAANVHGNSTNVPVRRWIDAFLVQPSMNRSRTSAGDIYVEIIGVTQSGAAGETAGQVVRRDVPYLIR